MIIPGIVASKAALPAFSLITHAIATGGADGGDSGSFNSTGANMLIATVFDYSGASFVLPTDNKGNTFILGATISSPSTRVSICYAKNAIVGSGHIVHFSEPGGYLSGAVEAWANANTTTPKRSASAGGTLANYGLTIQPGTTGVLGSATDMVVSASVWGQNNPLTTAGINSGFTISDSIARTAASAGGILAYIVPGVTNALNPTHSWDGGDLAAISAVFKQ